MTGWRIGYLLGPEPLIEQTSKLAELMHSSVNSTAQYAAVAALTGPQEHVTAMREEYCAKRQIVLDELDGCTALRLIEPQGRVLRVRGRASLRHGLRQVQPYAAGRGARRRGARNGLRQ